MANATGFTVLQRGMSRGLEYRGDVMEIGTLYDVEQLRELGGVVDYVVGTPLTKVYRLAEHEDPKQQHYLELYKMGKGPLYSFFIPYHLVHFEVPFAIARAVLFRDSVAKPLAGPIVEVCAVAKRDLEAGETLDDYGMYTTYGEAVTAAEMSRAPLPARGPRRRVHPAAGHRAGRVAHVRRRRLARGTGRRTVCAPSSSSDSRRDVALRTARRAAGAARDGRRMKVVIFCGGLGVRMGEETQRIPKPMIRIGNRPILWHIMRYYAAWGHTEFVLCLGYKGDVIKEYFLSYNEALFNDFVLDGYGADAQVEILNRDVGPWRITFADTGTQSTIGERLKASSRTSAATRCSWRPTATGCRTSARRSSMRRVRGVREDGHVRARPATLPRTSSSRHADGTVTASAR